MIKYLKELIVLAYAGAMITLVAKEPHSQVVAQALHRAARAQPAHPATVLHHHGQTSTLGFILLIGIGIILFVVWTMITMKKPEQGPGQQEPKTNPKGGINHD